MLETAPKTAETKGTTTAEDTLNRKSRDADVISGGHLVARALKNEGVDTIFTLCGGHIIDIYDGCVDEGIKVIDVRHEQVAAHAADGHARITGTPGYAVVTAGRSGPEHRADAPVLLLLEHAVAPGPVVQAHRVGGEVAGGQFPRRDAVQQHRDVALPVLLGTAHGQPLVHHRAEREPVDQSDEDAEDEDRAMLAFARVKRHGHAGGANGVGNRASVGGVPARAARRATATSRRENVP